MFDLTNHRFAFLDIETTGLSPWFGDRICEVGLVLTEGKRIQETYEILVHPGRELSPAAASTNGLTDEMLASAPAFEAVADEVSARLQDRVVVCHNAGFDLQFLDSEFKRLDRELQIPNLIDTLYIARERFELPSNSLRALAEAFQVSMEDTRHALGDALLCRQLLFLRAGRARRPPARDRRRGSEPSRGAVRLGDDAGVGDQRLGCGGGARRAHLRVPGIRNDT